MEKQEDQPKSVANKGSWFAGYIVAGLIWTFSQSFRKTTTDEFIVLIVAIGAGYFYHRLKSKIKIKSELARIVVTFILLEIITGGLIGILTAYM